MRVVPLPLQHDAVVDVAQQRIKEYILANRLKAGAHLPPEHELAATLGISRNSVREALRALITAGVVETRHGRGSFVSEVTLAPLLAGFTFGLLQRLESTTRTLRELLDLREIVEIELVRRIIGLHTDEQLAHLERLVARMEETGNALERFDPLVDAAFHVALYEPLGNQVMMQFLSTFWEVQAAVETQLPDLPAMQATNARWHRAILTAIKSGDAAAASAAMHEQFSGIRRKLAALTERETDTASGAWSDRCARSDW